MPASRRSIAFEGRAARPRGGHRGACARFVEMFAAGLALALALGCHAEHAAAGSAESGAGAERMRALLREIRDRSRDDNHWLGAGPLAAARARLEALPRDADPDELERQLVEVAEHELRLGEEEHAIQHFLAARELLETRPDAAPGERDELLFRLAVAWLRWGETRNCRRHPSAESCILPIRGGGLHRDQEGSRQAIHWLEEVLSSTDPSSPLAVKAVWLLNLAYMTVGGYPDQVPPTHRIPAAVFDGETFLRFDNVAPALGVDTVSLSGGAVIDDFDGDGWLDLFTTTFDTSSEPRFSRNRGGRFEDSTGAAGLAGLYGGLHVVHADYDNDGDLDLYILRGAWLGSAGRHPNSLLRNDGGSFTDVTFAAGLGEAFYPTQTAAWADYDNDGWVDLFVGNEHGGAGLGVYRDLAADIDAPCQLFRNRGDGTFEDVATAAGVAVRAYVKGVAWGDVDEDRFPDLYLSILGEPNRLLRNRGDGGFTDITVAAGVAEPVHSFPTWFFDYDQDGHLDLWVSSYRGAPGSVALVAASWFGQSVPWDLAKLYRGDGAGHFLDVTAAAGLDRLDLAMGSNFGDLDGDGFPEVYLGTGYPDYEGLMPNVLYRNVAALPGGVTGRRFADATLASGMGHLQKGHAVSFADFDADGDLDVFEQMGGAFPGDAYADALYRNPGTGAHWLALVLDGRRSNRAGLGARLRVDLVENGRRRSLFSHVSAGSSFGGNPLRQTFGLGAAVAVERLVVYWPTSDLTQTFAAPAVDRFYRVVEGEPDLIEPSLQRPASPALSTSGDHAR
jgi:hypothetical protein